MKKESMKPWNCKICAHFFFHEKFCSFPQILKRMLDLKKKKILKIKITRTLGSCFYHSPSRKQQRPELLTSG